MNLLLQKGESLLIEKKSKFIGEAFPISGEAQARERLEAIRKRHWDASHHVYAYICEEATKYSDDNEPSGTAGRPILDVMRGMELTGAMAVVIRYFGGTLLGTGGLLRAYSQSAKEALLNASPAPLQSYLPLSIRTEYTHLGRLQTLSKEQEAEISNIQYEDKITLELLLPTESKEKFLKALRETFDGRVEALVKDPLFGVLQKGRIKNLSEISKESY